MVHLVHQCQQPPDFAAREPFAGHPVKVVPGQVGNEPAFVFAERHGKGDKAFEVWDLHERIVHGFALSHSRFEWSWCVANSTPG